MKEILKEVDLTEREREFVAEILQGKELCGPWPTKDNIGYFTKTCVLAWLYEAARMDYIRDEHKRMADAVVRKIAGFDEEGD